VGIKRRKLSDDSDPSLRGWGIPKEMMKKSPIELLSRKGNLEIGNQA
jgi:hypothetical protein